MHKLTLAQMRQSIPRLIAAGLAIAIAVGFIAVTLVGAQVYTRTTLNTMAAQYAQADLVLNANALGNLKSNETVANELQSSEAVSDFYLREFAHGTVRSADNTRHTFGGLRPAPHLDKFLDGTLTQGEFQVAPGQILLADSAAELLQVAVGDQIILSTPGEEVYDPETDSYQILPQDWPLTVSGIYHPSAELYSGAGGSHYLHPDLFQKASWGNPADALIITNPNLTLEQASTELRAIYPGIDAVQTPLERAEYDLEATTDSTGMLTITVLIFATIALIVAAMVIANTFQVLLAQRAHTLAMLRCTGASTRQLRTMVRLEALILGACASIAGLILVFGLGQLALTFFHRTKPELHLPGNLPLGPMPLAVPVLVGVAVTLVAAQSAASAASAVSPLEALRPRDTLRSSRRASRLRVWVASFGIGLGILLGYYAWSADGTFDQSLPLLSGICAVALVFTGFLLLARWWLPQVVQAVGRILPAKLSGVSGSLARANSQRNPSRTAATASALLIGVALVTAMSTGAASARATLNHQLDEKFVVDALVDVWEPTQIEEIASTVSQNSNVLELAQLQQFEVSFDSGVQRQDVELQYSGALGGIQEQMLDTARSKKHLAELKPGVLLVNPRMDLGGTPRQPGITDATEWFGYQAGDQIELVPAVRDTKGSETLQPEAAVTFTVAFTAMESPPIFLLPDLADQDWQVQGATTWLRFADLGSAVSTGDDLRHDLSSFDVSVFTPAAERAMYEQIIDVLLAIVLGLLAVAVVIAVIGVTNTLSLSVLERRRESATLRTIGLSASQLRASLALEGVLTALAGTCAGIILGLAAGWFGSRILLGELGTVVFAVPWLVLVVVLVVAVAAGTLASWIPARMATRRAPLADLHAL